MQILTISGSARSDSTNVKLLNALPKLMLQSNFHYYEHLHNLPLFTEDTDKAPFVDMVLEWRNAVQNTDAVIISTPEYLHNIPALLKNALEWLSSSGELLNKPVLPITFTPHAPRGEKAMQSLLNTLDALKARVVGQLDLYQTEVIFDEEGRINNIEMVELLKLSIEAL